MSIKSHLYALAIGAATISTALAPANARGFGGMAAHAGGVASAPSVGRPHFGAAMTRLPALHAPKFHPVPGVGPSGILTRSKVGQLPTGISHAGGFGQIVTKVQGMGTPAPSTATSFGAALKAAAAAVPSVTGTSGSGIGQAIQKAKDAIDKAALQPATAGGLQHGIDKLRLPAGTLGDKAQVPATKGSDTGSTPSPNPTNPSTNPTSPSHGPLGGGYGGGVVVAAPVDVPAVTVADRPAATVVGPRVVQQSPACGPSRIPSLAAALDQLMPTAQLAAADLEVVRALRIAIADLAAAGKYVPARAVEEQAMRMLGYGKLWLRCGDGSFTWTRQVAAVQ